VTITGNTFWEGFQHDLLIQHSSHIVVTGNNFDRNPRYIVNGFQGAEHNGLILRHCSETTINANTISGVLESAAALEVSDSRRMIISNNNILDSDGAGLFLKNVSDSLVTANLVRDDRAPGPGTRAPGIRVEGGTGNVLGTNLVKDR
jgi:parallel beta-helix repeat protein